MNLILSIRHWMTNKIPPGSMARWIVKGFLCHPIVFFVSFLNSVVATKKLTGAFFPVVVRLNAGTTIHINKHPQSKTLIKGILHVDDWCGMKTPVSITCDQGSTLEISGDFSLGPGVHIILGRNARLKIGGKKFESASGITCDTRIMVEEEVLIGFDAIIAWDVFITDSDWHNISGIRRCVPVKIGDHVWIAHGVSVVKGAQIPQGCVVGAKSLVCAAEFPEDSLIAGVPATLRRGGIDWSR